MPKQSRPDLSVFVRASVLAAAVVALGVGTHRLKNALAGDDDAQTQVIREKTDQAFAELEERSRAAQPALPGLQRSVGGAFGNLRGEWRVLVFPRLSEMTDKESLSVAEEHSVQTELMYDRPQEYRFRVRRNEDCGQLLNAPKPILASALATAAFTRTRDYFLRAVDPLRAGPAKDCAVVEVSRVRGWGTDQPNADFIDATNWRKDDVVKVSLYIDSDYRNYGMDVESATGPGTSQVRHLRTDPKLALSSGLLAFPLDLPVLASAKGQAGTLELPADPFVGNRLQRMTVATSCPAAATRFEYQDLYGSAVQVMWCHGDAWPSAVSTPRFFSILKRQAP